MSALAQAIAAEIRAESGRQRVSGRELARRIDQPTTTVSRWLNGETVLRLDDLDKIAAALEVDVLDLIRAAQVRVKLPRKDSNLQPAGRESAVVRTRILPFVRPLRELQGRPVCTRPGVGSWEYPQAIAG